MRRSLGHWRRHRIRNRDQRGTPGAMRGARPTARSRLNRAQSRSPRRRHRFGRRRDPRSSGPEPQPVAPYRAGTAELVVEQFRHAAAASKNPRPRSARPACRALDCVATDCKREMRFRPAASASSFSATSNISGLGPRRAGLGAARERRGLRRPPQPRVSAAAQVRPSRRIAIALASRVKASGIGARLGREVAHRAGGGVIIVGGDEAPRPAAARIGKDGSALHSSLRGGWFRQRPAHETYVSHIAAYCNI